MKIVADANIPFVQECFSSVGDVTVMGGRDMTAAALADADALLVRSITQVDGPLLAGTAVKFVGTATIGFDHVDLDCLHSHHIGFASAPGSNANSAAEYIIAALLDIGDRTEIEWFVGPHTIHGQGTYDFLHKHLDWAKPDAAD